MYRDAGGRRGLAAANPYVAESHRRSWIGWCSKSGAAIGAPRGRTATDRDCDYFFASSFGSVAFFSIFSTPFCMPSIIDFSFCMPSCITFCTSWSRAAVSFYRRRLKTPPSRPARIIT